MAISSASLFEHSEPGVVAACDSASQTYLAARDESYVVRRFSGETIASFEGSVEHVPLPGMNGADGRYVAAIEATDPTPQPFGILLDRPSGPHVRRIQLDRLIRVLHSGLLADGRALFFSPEPRSSGKITAFVLRPDGSVGELGSNVLQSTGGTPAPSTVDSLIRIVGSYFIVAGYVATTRSVVYCKASDTLECRVSNDPGTVLVQLTLGNETCHDRAAMAGGMAAVCSFVDDDEACVSFLDLSAGMEDRIRQCVHPLPVVDSPASDPPKAWKYATRDNPHAPVIALLHNRGDRSDLRAGLSLAPAVSDVYLIVDR